MAENGRTKTESYGKVMGEHRYGKSWVGRVVAVLWVSMAKCTIHVNWFTHCENTARISPSVSPWSRPPVHGQRGLGCVVNKLTLAQSHYFHHTQNHNGLMNQPLTISVSNPAISMKTTVSCPGA